jgi:hypothetical protein
MLLLPSLHFFKSPLAMLNKAETKALHHHYKLFFERIQRLHKCTPEAVVFFLAGSLPIAALLHLRQLTILGMIARLGPDNILHKHATTVLNNPRFNVTRSWFTELKHTCSQYSLDSPLSILTNLPPPRPS